MNGKIRTVCSYISLATVALLSSLVGYRVTTVATLVFSTIILDNVCLSLYNRVYAETVKATWSYWVTIVTAVIGILLLMGVSQTGWNILMWFSVLCFLCAVIFGAIDYKIRKKAATATEETTEEVEETVSGEIETEAEVIETETIETEETNETEQSETNSTNLHG